MNRAECFERLATIVDREMLTVTSFSQNSAIWSRLSPTAAGFYDLNMGLCVPFALGVSLAFPKRKVLAVDSDGSLMLDPGALITVADANPTNLMVLVFDNQAYARMGATPTSRLADLEHIAQGSGIKKTATVKSLEDFEDAMATMLGETGPSFCVAKIEAETVRAQYDARKRSGRPMRERFVDGVLSLPDYWPKSH